MDNLRPDHSAGYQDWTNTEAACRFLSNGRVNETAILNGHFQATRERFAATEGPILILHDTTEFSYTRESKEAIGGYSVIEAKDMADAIALAKTWPGQGVEIRPIRD